MKIKSARRPHRKKRRSHFNRRVQIDVGFAPAPPDPIAHPTEARIMAYGADDLFEDDFTDISTAARLRERFPVVWIDVTGTSNTEFIRQLGAAFNLHTLSIEDVVHSHQRAKVDDYGTYLFLIARMAPITGETETDQLGMFLGDGFVITVQERPGDDIGPVRRRIRANQGRFRSMGADYLMYSILDAVIDAYFPLLEARGEDLDALEDDVILNPGPELMNRIYEIRREFLGLRKALWPLRDATNILLRDGIPTIKPETRVYLRDCYDHTIQIMDLLENFREISSGLMEVYLSSVGNRLNEVMKVLTIITTIFIPLTFIAGIYGMNFHTQRSPWNMPELTWYFGYPMVMLFMTVIAVGQLILFRRKGWLGKTGKNLRSDAPKDAPGHNETTR